MRTGAGQANQTGTRDQVCAADNLSFFDHANTKPCQIVVAIAVETRHFCGFSTNQRAAGKLTASSDAFDYPLGSIHIELAGRVVIKEQKGFGTGHQHIVGAHGHQILANLIVAIEIDREFQLGADTVGACDQDRLAITTGQFCKGSKSADTAKLFGASGGASSRGNSLHQFIAGIDVYTRVTIGKAFAQDDHCYGISRGAESTRPRLAISVNFGTVVVWRRPLPRPGFRWLTRLTLGAWLLCSAAGTHAVSVVPWLYEVAVPVDSQSTADRQRASSQALLIMLARATGLSYVPRSEPVREALANPERYYNEFSFANQSDEGLDLLIQFDPRAVLELLKRADLPIWRSARDRVVAWLVLERGGERILVGAATTDEASAEQARADEVKTALVERSRDRGLDLSLPLLDLEDQLNVTPAAVWGRLSQVLEPASRRYDADVLLVGRLQETAPDQWLGEWEFWLDNQVLTHQTSGPDLLTQAAQMVDLLTDELAARNAVLGRESGALQLSVSGVRNPADYGSLLSYLRSLEFIDAVAVSRLQGDRLWIDLQTRADADQLGDLFEADGQMFRDRLALVGAADLQLVWRQQ